MPFHESLWMASISLTFETDGECQFFFLGFSVSKKDILLMLMEMTVYVTEGKCLHGIILCMILSRELSVYIMSGKI